MASNVVVASSTIANNVLTLVLKVADTGTPVTNFDLSFAYDTTKLSFASRTVPAFWIGAVDAAANPGVLSTSFVGGQGDDGNIVPPVAAGATLLTVRFNVLATAETSFNVTMSGLYNSGPSIPIPATPFALANGSVSSPVQGLPTITGTASEDQVLTANITALSDGDGLPTSASAFTYTWLRDNATISGQTASTYTLTAADIGKKISVKVSYTDLQGHAETSSASAQTTAVVHVNHNPSGTVTIAGNNAKGATLTATSTVTDTDGLGTLTYEWTSGTTVVQSTTSNTYVLKASDVGNQVFVTVKYTDLQGTQESKASTPTAAVVADHAHAGGITLSTPGATQNVGLSLTDTVTDVDGIPATGNGSKVYQWFAADDAGGTNSAAINGANGASFTPTQAQVGKFITAKVTYTDSLGNTETVASSSTTAVANVNDAPQGSVTVTNSTNSGQPPRQGDMLAATDTITDADGIAPTGADAKTYHWFADTTEITAALGMKSYQLTEAEVGKTIKVTVSYKDLFGQAESVSSTPTTAVINVNDAPTGSITVTGDLTQGQTISLSNNIQDIDGIPLTGANKLTYHWFSGANEITAALGQSSYQLTQAEVGKALTVTATYTDSHGTSETVPGPAAGATVGNINDAPTGALTITGALSIGSTLGFTSTVADLDGIPTTGANAPVYHWLADNDEVATGTTFKLTANQLGKTITLMATYTDNFGAHEMVSVTKAGTVQANAFPTGAVTVTGSATQFGTLTVTSNLVDPDNQAVSQPTPAPTYKWFTEDAQGAVTDTGVTGTTFSLNPQSLVGMKVFARASYTDALGKLEEVDSDRTAAVANVDEALTGTVTITGVVRQYETLTAVTSTLADPDGQLTLAYEWSAGGTPIANQTGSTLVLGQDQVGKAISVKVTATDPFFNSAVSQTIGKTVLNASTGATLVANVNDHPTGGVSVSGNYTQGQTLTVTNDIADIDGIPLTGANKLTYHWFASGNEITSAVGQSSYVLTQAEVGKVVTVTATYTDSQGTAESVPGTVPDVSVGNVNDPPVSTLALTGSLAVGASLGFTGGITDLDGIPPGAISYTWLSNDVPVGSNTTYKLNAGDLNHTIKLVASYTDSLGQSESVTLTGATPVRANAAATGTVTVTGLGTATQNQTLTVTSAVLTDQDNTDAHVAIPGLSYQWYMDNGQGGETAIANATGTTFTLTQAQVGHKVWVAAGFRDVLGVDERVDSPKTTNNVVNVDDALVGAVTIDGTAREDQVLTANTSALTDPDGALTFTYKWFSGTTVIANQTSKTLTLGQAQVGKTVSVEVTATDALGGVATRTTQTAVVANVNDPTLGVPTIAGVPEQNQTLTVSTSGLSDEDGLPTTFGYQWFANNVAIAGATASTYKLTQGEVDKTITVKVSYTDLLGTPEPAVSSAPTAAVANVNDSPTGLPTIDGAKVIGMQLAVSMARVVDLDGIPTPGNLGQGSLPVYKWFANGTEINTTNFTAANAFTVSADGSVITLKDGNSTTGFGGKTITASVTYKDKYGFTESFTTTQIASVTMASEADVDSPSGTQATKGDGNGDGIPDNAQQAVASAPFVKQGTSGASQNSFVTLVADPDPVTGKPKTTTPGGATENVVINTIFQEKVADQPATKAPPPKMDAPLGIIDFEAAVPVVPLTGYTATFTLFADKDLKVNGYWKQNEKGKWVNLATDPFGGSTVTTGNKTKLTFKITDGSFFDSDHAVNGIIVDPGLIGSLPLSLVGYTPDVVLTAQTHFFF